MSRKIEHKCHGTRCYTPCPHGAKHKVDEIIFNKNTKGNIIKVYSVTCQRCDYYESGNKKSIICNYGLISRNVITK